MITLIGAILLIIAMAIIIRTENNSFTAIVLLWISAIMIIGGAK